MWTIEDRGHESPCWLWDRAVNGEGYGQAWDATLGRQVSAHRLVYVEQVGPIPEGLELDHLCRVRSCVNPAHLEPVTHAENLRRSPIAPATINSAKTECPRGHSLTPENLLSRATRRDCRTCHRDRERSRRARLREDA